MIFLPVLVWALFCLTQGRSIDSVVPVTEHGLNSTSFGTYNSTYPLPTPSVVSNGTKYRIALVSDLDDSSKKGNAWISYLQKGYLTYNPTKKSASVQWDEEPVEMTSGFAYNDRGMELSELVVFDGKLLSVDDRTGIIYELDDLYGKLHPWVILSDGDGRSPKGFKSEWATVKNDTLFVGGHGKAFTNADRSPELVKEVVEIDCDPQWVKTVSKTGEVQHFNWKNNYVSLLLAQGLEAPGYSKHESGLWSPVNERWYFLPRQSSTEVYNREKDELLGTNVLLSANPDFSDITVTHVGEIIPSRGYSSMKFIPGTNDSVVVALKVEEISGNTSTYITVFTTSGEVILADSKVADYKYEGIEFV